MLWLTLIYGVRPNLYLFHATKPIGIIKPSSVIEKYMDEIGLELIHQINLITPGALPPVKFKTNQMNVQGEKLIGIGLLILLIATFIDNWIVAGLGMGVFGAGCWIVKKSINAPSEQFEFEGITTFRDLVFKIKKHRNSLA